VTNVYIDYKEDYPNHIFSGIDYIKLNIL